MEYIDMHAHMVSRTTDDYHRMALTGCVAVTEPAFWAGFDRGSADAFEDYFRQLTEFEQFETRLRREQQVRETLRGERAELALGVLDGEGHEAESRVRREFDARRDQHGRDARAAGGERGGREDGPHGSAYVMHGFSWRAAHI